MLYVKFKIARQNKSGLATAVFQVFPHKQILFINIVSLLFAKDRKFKETVKDTK